MNPSNGINTYLIAIHWHLNVFDRGEALAITPDGLRCQSREGKEWHGCRANKGVRGTGKYFFEAIVTDEGLCRVGWSTNQVLKNSLMNQIISSATYQISNKKDERK